MEPVSQAYDQLLKDLLELGFNQIYIGKALQLTNDKEKAVELILKFQEDEEEFNMNKALTNSKSEQNQTISSQPNPNVIPNIPITTNPQNLENKPFEKENEEDAWYFPKNDFKMVILVRADLKMGVGKIAAQVGHAGFFN